MNAPLQEDVEFLEHFGVKGMQWGVRKNTKAAQQTKARSKGLGQKQLKSESARVKAAGGGLKGTRAVRKEMIKNGELSKADARKGTARFARNLGIGVAGAALIGAGAVYASKKMGSSGNVSMKTVSATVRPGTKGGLSKQHRDMVNSIMSKHEAQTKLFDADLRKQANLVGKHYVSPHIPWVPI